MLDLQPKGRKGKPTLNALQQNKIFLDTLYLGIYSSKEKEWEIVFPEENSEAGKWEKGKWVQTSNSPIFSFPQNIPPWGIPGHHKHPAIHLEMWTLSSLGIYFTL